MIKINVKTKDQYEKLIEMADNAQASAVVKKLEKDLPYQILSCRINNVNESLNATLKDNDELYLLDIRDASANMSYQASATFLYIKAVHDVLGQSVNVVINNSLSKGLFTQIKTNGITDQTATAISWRMQELVNEDIPFELEELSASEMLERLKGDNSIQHQLLKSAKDISSVKLYRLDNEEEIFYHDLVPSTSYIKLFEIKRYKNGMLLRLPQPTSPKRVPPYEEQKLLYDAFSEATRWDRILGINYASDLNKKVLDDDYQELILLSEALHEKKIAEIADQIFSSGKRIVLIAGPSSSGKTTFANRLCIQLKVLGLKPLYLGTDDYFKNRDETPLLPSGEKDYESLRAIDVNLFAKHMNALVSGKKVDLPTYDFIDGIKKYGKRIASVENNQPIVIEGIHALNPELTKDIDEDLKFRIYISPLTQLNIDPYNRIPTSDARMLRRMVRDNLHRGYDASQTIKSWPLVREGEEKYIFPYSQWADVFFNSHCLYELSVLKKYAQPLLLEIQKDSFAYPEAQRLLEFLNFFAVAQNDSCIPNNSIIREFIGGSVLV